MDGLAVQPDLTRDRIELQRAHPDPAEPRSRPGAPQQRLDPPPEFSIAERLGQVVVAAPLKPPDAVKLAGPAGEDEDRQLRVEPSPGLAGLAELAQQVEPVAIREAE